MAIIVGENSYITVLELEAYALDRGVTILATTKEPLLIKAMDYLETRLYTGDKTDSTQLLQFPRYYDTEVPTEIKSAQCIAALLIDAGNDLQAIMTQSIKSEKVDVLDIVYQDNTTAYTQFTKLNDILRPFMASGIRGIRI